MTFIQAVLDLYNATINAIATPAPQSFPGDANGVGTSRFESMPIEYNFNQINVDDQIASDYWWHYW
jgi:hypothetical protein